MSRAKGIIAALVVGGAAVSSAIAEDADRGVLARHADRLSATFEDANDTDAYTVELFEGGRLDVLVRTPRRSGITPRVRLFAPDGAERDVAAFVRGAGGPRPTLRRFIVPPGGTGTWTVRLDGGGTAGTYFAIFKIRDVKVVRSLRLVLPAGSVATIPFTARNTALATLTLRSRSGDAPAQVRILSPDGSELVTRDDLLERRRKLIGRRLALSGGLGRYALELTGAPDTGAVLDVTLRLAIPRIRRRRVTLGPEVTLAAVAPATVRQEAAGVVLTLTGTNFTSGSWAEVSGQGVTVTDVSTTGPTTAEVTIDVAEDAPFGIRDVTFLPPLLDAEPVTLADAVTLQAPDPVVTSAAPMIVE